MPKVILRDKEKVMFENIVVHSAIPIQNFDKKFY